MQLHTLGFKETTQLQTKQSFPMDVGELTCGYKIHVAHCSCVKEQRTNHNLENFMMKQLKKTRFTGATELTREQLKKVMGGNLYIEDEDSNGSPKTEACKSLKAGSKCSYAYQNNVYNGCCTSYMASEIFCSTLDTSCF